ncbi:M20/M25/M40 family metallo-hydrolase [Corallococcus praedator]|uniref:M20/M25/M40 family metallo-hydrolase n=1 Tax=Corallococcus praedator TaxID=2316724 RepID=A0ABX9QL43_9BACT|nr:MULTISPECIES: M20/M25/M40 family metallo-hydrolase [Corallococcus]RKH18558.1 M20/M25/M40 family metallo-hydrolase [Corallococcus sp. CA047B]RKH26973.1 M20/M25/M40 family metallo-hydrolase [Corallococcus sp. CA031C]RKI12161.1 M20/M25/M40 family metallo-hydrolase [Corallococcus praedator]
MNTRLATLSAVALVGLTVAFALHFAAAPTALPATAPAEVFSAGRARAHLEHIAAVPHPVGSRAHRDVREYLLRTLRESGVTPEVQVTSAINPTLGTGRTIPGSTVHNVLAHLKGVDGSKVVAIVAHYDSVPTSPGASDDGAGVAAMLETLRALRTGPPLRNDVLFIFMDAEETGLVGARAFTLQHPLAKRVSVVLNFEARGSRGPSLMFQPSPDSRWLIERLARSGAPVQASSLFDETYRRLPNETDFSIFLKAGTPGLNFGFIDGFMRYHTRLDDLTRLDPDSLQHHGEMMLALARHLGQDPLEPAPMGSAVYFNVGPFLVHHASSWAVPLALLALLACGAAIAVGLRRGALRATGLLKGVGALLATTAGSAAVIQAAWWLVRRIDGGLSALPQRDAYQGRLFIVGLLALTLATVAGFQALFLRKVRRAELAAGALIAWTVLGLVSAFVASGLSYLFTWPVVFGALGLGWRWREPGETLTLRTRLVLAASAIPGLLLWVPQVPHFYVALTLFLVAVVTAVVAPWLALLLAQTVAEPVRLGRTVAPLAFALAVVLLGVGVVRERFDVETPRPSSLAYVVDATSNEAYWLSGDYEPDAWVSQVLGGEATTRRMGDYLPLFPKDVRVAPAPMRALPAPEVRVERDETRDGLRQLALRVTSRRQATQLQIQLGPHMPLRGLSIAGHRLEPEAIARTRDRETGTALVYWDAPPEGILLEFSVPEGTRVPLRVTDLRFDLSEAPGAPGDQRPAGTIPVPFYFGVTDETLVSIAVEY